MLCMWCLLYIFCIIDWTDDSKKNERSQAETHLAPIIKEATAAAISVLCKVPPWRWSSWPSFWYCKLWTWSFASYFDPSQSCFIFSNFSQAETMSLKIDSQVLTKVHDIIKEGVTKPRVIKVMLNLFVKNELFKGQQLPSLLDRRYYPTDKDLRNILYKWVFIHHLSQCDWLSYYLKLP